MIQQPDSLFSDRVTAKGVAFPQSLAEEVEWRGGEGRRETAFGGGRLQIHHIRKVYRKFYIHYIFVHVSVF